MLRKLTKVLMALACVAMIAGVADAAPKKHRVAKTKQHKATMEDMIRKAVSEAIQDNKPALSGKYEFTAKRMRPPKNKKWTKRWNELGQDGWQMVGNNENIYIFQRPGAIDLAAADKGKTDKKAAADSKKAQEKADKDAKKAAKDAEKAAKKAAKGATGN